MKILSICPELLYSTNAKVCRQCRKKQLIRHFISKNGNGICITCDLCRQVQGIRWRGIILWYVWLLERKQRKRQMIKQNILSPISPSNQCEDSTLHHPHSPSISPYSTDLSSSICNSFHSDNETKPSDQQLFPVPFSTWVSCPVYLNFDDSNCIIKAKLVFHRSCFKC